MTFSSQFRAATKAEAQEKLKSMTLPAAIKEYIGFAIMNIADSDNLAGIFVKADGHLCDGISKVERSTCYIIVEPILLPKG